MFLYSCCQARLWNVSSTIQAPTHAWYNVCMGTWRLTPPVKAGKSLYDLNSVPSKPNQTRVGRWHLSSCLSVLKSYLLHSSKVCEIESWSFTGMLVRLSSQHVYCAPAWGSFINGRIIALDLVKKCTEKVKMFLMA